MSQPAQIASSKQRAFSLFELIIVILVLAVLSISFVKILSQSVSSYLDASDRNEHSQSAKWVTEIITRSVREALPQSIRTGRSGDFDCLEYIEIINASRYFNLSANGGITQFNVVTFDLAFQANLFTAVMPVNTASIYNGSGVLSLVASITASAPQESLVSLVGANTFSQRSPQNRVYFVSTPVSFCLNNNTGLLIRYTNYGFLANLSFPPIGGIEEIIADNFWSTTAAFNYQAGRLQASGLLQLNFLMQNKNRYPASGSEDFSIFHEVHIRNVP